MSKQERWAGPAPTLPTCRMVGAGRTVVAGALAQVHPASWVRAGAVKPWAGRGRSRGSEGLVLRKDPMKRP